MDWSLNQLLIADVGISVFLSHEELLGLVGVEGAGWKRSTFSGDDPKHPLGTVPVPVMVRVTLVVEAVEVVVPAVANRTFQVFLKAFSNLAKGVFSPKEEPPWWFQAGKSPVLHLAGNGGAPREAAGP